MFCADAIGPLKRRVIRELEESGQIGSTKKHIVKCPFYEDREPDLSALGANFLWHSPLTPTSDELLSGKMWIGNNDNNEQSTVTPDAVLFNTDVLYGFMLCHVPCVVAYKAGNYTVEYGGTNLPLTIPKTGIYLATVAGEYSTYLGIEWETIHPISDKYLPGVCLPVVELSTEPTNGGVQLTDAEAAKIEKIFTAGKPAVITFPYAGTTLSSVFMCMAGAGFVTDAVVGQFQISNDTGVWIITDITA